MKTIAYASCGLIWAQCAFSATVVVNPNASDAYRDLASAVKVLNAGDTLWLAPESGPYREVLHIRASGTESRPIIIEGNGNEITGFEPLVFVEGRCSPSVAYPFVLRHNGQRVMELESSNGFSHGIRYNAQEHRLELLPGSSPEGWEISSRDFVVRIQDVSYQEYRNLVVSGSLNDGINLHGEGCGLSFTGLTACQNLDEGFSSHGSIQCSIYESLFYENDNGLLNGFQTDTTLEQVVVRDNLGIGLAFNGEATVQASKVELWGNGLVQLLLRPKVQLSFDGLTVYRNHNETRPWKTYNESARWSHPKTLDIGSISLETDELAIVEACHP
jgi:hypothetical protein